jgi:hypothetical protein
VALGEVAFRILRFLLSVSPHYVSILICHPGINTVATVQRQSHPTDMNNRPMDITVISKIVIHTRGTVLLKAVG